MLRVKASSASSWFIRSVSRRTPTFATSRNNDWTRKSTTSSKDSSVRIGDTEIPVFENGKNPELVPRGFLRSDEELSNETLRHLRWIHRKVELSQDIFLLGPPGPEKRHLAMAYCELTNRETEIVTLTRDTTESDLKQRREIVNGSALFMNQPPVRAALEGRILVIDGIEAAERNVLPTLNNLLENREMQLEDGRFLVNPRTFDEMAKNMSSEEMTNRGLLRVSEDFRVITISVPVPPYSGYTLDPPLRSRFQGHVVEPGNIEELYVSSVRISIISHEYITRSNTPGTNRWYDVFLQ